MERLGDIVARVLANVRDTMDGEEKAGGAVETPPEGAARRVGRITARMGEEGHRHGSARMPKPWRAAERRACSPAGPTAHKAVPLDGETPSLPSGRKNRILRVNSTQPAFSHDD